MASHVPAAISGIVAAVTSALASEDAEVVDSWRAANTSGTVVTIGMPDPTFRDLGALTSPAASVTRSDPPIGYGQTQAETVAIRCKIETAPVGDSTDPADVRAEAGRIYGLCLAALPGAIDGAASVYTVEDEWFQADGTAGWFVLVTFTVRAVFL